MLYLNIIDEPIPEEIWPDATWQDTYFFWMMKFFKTDKWELLTDSIVITYSVPDNIPSVYGEHLFRILSTIKHDPRRSNITTDIIISRKCFRGIQIENKEQTFSEYLYRSYK